MLPFDTSLAANVRMLIRATTSTLLVVTLMAGALLTGAKPAAAVDIKSVEAGVYRIIQRSAKGGGTGTGFLVGGKGKHVVTNNHVVEGDDDTEIFIAYRNANGSPEVVKARVVYKTAQQDLALIEADAILPGAPFTLAEYEPEKLSEVYAVGFPGKADIVAGRGSGIDPRTLDPTMTTGSVSRVVMASNKDMKVSALTVQHSAAINPGNSGGPLFDGCGRVIGVNTFLPKDSQGIFFSIHSGEVVKMLRSQNSPPKTATGGCGSIQLMLSKGLTGTTALLSAFAATTIFSMAALVVALRTRPQLRQQLATRFSRVVGRPPDPTRYDPRAAQAGGLIVGGAGGRMAGGQAATSAMPQDLLLKGLDGRTHVVIGSRLIDRAGASVGRNPRADVVIDGDTISQTHATLTWDPVQRQVRVTDQRSTNGTTVNGRRIDTSLVAPGDRIGFGSQFYDVASGAVGGYSPAPAATIGMVGSTRAWLLSGFDSRGRAIQFELRANGDPHASWTVGRDRNRARFCIDDTSVSSLHAKFVCTSDGGIAVADLGSTNGTKVDGNSVGPNPVPISGAREITLGEAKLRITSLV